MGASDQVSPEAAELFALNCVRNVGRIDRPNYGRKKAPRIRVQKASNVSLLRPHVPFVSFLTRTRKEAEQWNELRS